MMKDENGNLITGEHELIAQWGNYFKGLLNVNNDHAESEGDIHTAELYVQEPIFREVRDALGKLKNNKAAGNDSLPAELLKYGGLRLAQEIYRLDCPFGEGKLYRRVGESPSSYRFLKRGIKRTLIITGESRCFQRATKFWLTCYRLD